MDPVIILGAGYTGSRTAGILESTGLSVARIRRPQIDFLRPESLELLSKLAPAGCVVLHSIPSLPNQADAKLLRALEGKARRIVYLSTTGVYGSAEIVDESTPIGPRNPREAARAHTESIVQQGPWQSLILRPAAIYGPDRGVHISMAQGRYTMIGEGGNFISRIHVDDLAQIVAAALVSDLTGAYPVADLHPCTSREIADYCAKAFNLPPAISTPADQVPESRRNNRKVDGSAICRILGITLKYPSYQDALAPLAGNSTL